MNEVIIMPSVRNKEEFAYVIRQEVILVCSQHINNLFQKEQEKDIECTIQGRIVMVSAPEGFKKEWIVRGFEEALENEFSQDQYQHHIADIDNKNVHMFLIAEHYWEYLEGTMEW
jgi:hypothetical protein